MKLRHKAPRGARVDYNFIGIQCMDFDLSESYWWDERLGQWTKDPSWGDGGLTNTLHGCQSAKAFKRRLKEWSVYLPHGLQFILISRWVGYDIIGTINNRK